MRKTSLVLPMVLFLSAGLLQAQKAGGGSHGGGAFVGGGHGAGGRGGRLTVTGGSFNRRSGGRWNQGYGAFWWPWDAGYWGDDYGFGGYPDPYAPEGYGNDSPTNMASPQIIVLQ